VFGNRTFAEWKEYAASNPTVDLNAYVLHQCGIIQLFGTNGVPVAALRSLIVS
jgi:hypothetical protein